MNFFQMLLKRESCRAYSEQPVDRKELIQIVEAGRLSPSGCNAQPWKFIIVDQPDSKKLLCDALLIAPDNLTGCPWRNQVPAFIIMIEQPARLMKMAMDYYHDTQRFAQGDLGMAAMNMCYAADELGLSTCLIGLNDQQKMEEYFKIPHGRQVRMVLAVGHAQNPTAAPREKIRKSFDEVCSFNQW